MFNPPHEICSGWGPSSRIALKQTTSMGWRARKDSSASSRCTHRVLQRSFTLDVSGSSSASFKAASSAFWRFGWESKKTATRVTTPIIFCTKRSCRAPSCSAASCGVDLVDVESRSRAGVDPQQYENGTWNFWGGCLGTQSTPLATPLHQMQGQGTRDGYRDMGWGTGMGIGHGDRGQRMGDGDRGRGDRDGDRGQGQETEDRDGNMDRGGGGGGGAGDRPIGQVMGDGRQRGGRLVGSPETRSVVVENVPVSPSVPHSC